MQGWGVLSVFKAIHVCRVPLEAVQSAAVEAVMPLFRAAVDAAEQHILRMHAQDFGGADAPAVAGASPYMADLVRHLSHCRHAPPRSSHSQTRKLRCETLQIRAGRSCD